MLPRPMLTALFPLKIVLDTNTIASASLWALALYLGFASASEWVTLQLNRWFDVAEQWLYSSAEEFERTRKSREAQNAFYAAILSIVPFLLAGGLCNYLVDLSLGRSWSISTGLIACMGAGVYELGRRTGGE